MNRRKSRQIQTYAPSGFRRNLVSLGVACALGASASMLVAPDANARITNLTITSTALAFGGYSYPGVGQYQKIVGTATGELNPNDPHNSGIVDLALAPRLANGNVQYTTSFYILKPVDLTKGNHKVHYEPPNRGSKTYSGLNRANGGNDPASLTDPAVLATAFLWSRGYTSVFVGWDQAAGTDPTGFNQFIILPIAKNADGSSITGPAYDYIVLGAGVISNPLTYTAATLDQTKATLTTRKHLNDAPVAIPASGWAYDATGNSISLLPAGTAFNANDIYEFSYIAKDPTVNGVGFAAFRDFMSFLRFSAQDDAGVKNPMAGDITRVYTEISSQPGRFLNDYVTLGFNADESSRMVVDGIMNWISAGSGIDGNVRFGQPGRTARNRQHLLYPESFFPFADVSTTDAISGKTQGRYTLCEKTNTCPLKMNIYSANEYWVKTASLLHTDPAGTVDLADYPLSRHYFMSSMQHGTGNATSKGLCQQFGNPLDSSPVQRALWTALDLWSTQGIAPPPTAVPRLDNKTMTKPLPQSAVGFPNIPGVQYTGLQTTRYRFNYGPNFYTTGIPTIFPPNVIAPYQDNPANGPIYQSYVPTTDADGNDIAGIRLPDVTVPLATYTGWALRSIANDGPDGCESTGQYIPFQQTQAARIAAGDPRLSVQERYGSFSGYYFALLFAINDMVGRRLMLAEDAPAAFNAGLLKVLGPGSSLTPKRHELELMEGTGMLQFGGHRATGSQ